MNISKISTLITLTSALASFSVNAGNSYSGFLSAGIVDAKATYELEGIDQAPSGFGINYAFIQPGNNLGVIFGIQTSSDDGVYYYEGRTLDASLDMSDFSVGPIYRFENANWLKLYPTVGVTYFDGEIWVSGGSEGQYSIRDDDLWFNYGLGLQVSLPYTPIFLDFNYKVIIPSGNYSEFDIDSFYLGVGYSF